jgi:hypothetical protein
MSWADVVVAIVIAVVAATIITAILRVALELLAMGFWWTVYRRRIRRKRASRNR